MDSSTSLGLFLDNPLQRTGESGKQSFRFRMAVDQILRMPLDGDREPAIIPLQRLGVALPGSGRNPQPAADPAGDLMVTGVHHMRSRTDRLGEPRSRLDLDPVRFRHARLAVIFDVLLECAAVSDIE